MREREDDARVEPSAEISDERRAGIGRESGEPRTPREEVPGKCLLISRRFVSMRERGYLWTGPVDIHGAERWDQLDLVEDRVSRVQLCGEGLTDSQRTQDGEVGAQRRVVRTKVCHQIMERRSHGPRAARAVQVELPESSRISAGFVARGGPAEDCVATVLPRADGSTAGTESGVPLRLCNEICADECIPFEGFIRKG